MKSTKSISTVALVALALCSTTAQKPVKPTIIKEKPTATVLSTGSTKPSVITPRQILMQVKASQNSAFFTQKFSKSCVWALNPDWNITEIGSDREISISGPAFVLVGGDDAKPVDWGAKGDRYMMLVPEKDGVVTNNSDGTVEQELCRFGVKLFECNGTLVSDLFSNGVVVAIGDKGFEFQVQGGIVLFFSKKPITTQDVFLNHITIAKAIKFAQL